MATRLLTERMMIQQVADRWARQYVDKPLGNCLLDGKDTHEVLRLLRALDTATASAADVKAIIGNDTWTRVQCDNCRSHVNEAVLVEQAEDYGSRTVTVCRPCILAAAAFPRTQ